MKWGIIKANAVLMDGAREYRFMVGPHQFRKSLTKYGTPYNTTFLRSIRYKNNLDWLWTIDIDKEKFDSGVLRDARKFNDVAYNILGIRPIMKFSGSHGIHEYVRMRFPKDMTETDVSKAMRDIAYSIYTACDFDNENGPLFGRLQKKSTDRAFFDTSIFDPSRIVRGVSIHFGSQLFSVPIKHTDTMFEVMQRSKLKYPIPEFRLETVSYDPSWIVYRYEGTNLMSQPPSVVDIGDINVMNVPARNDMTYRLLPKSLKATVVSSNPDPLWRMALVSYLYSALPDDLAMSRDDIITWLRNNCSWADNIQLTSYQVNYICNRVERVWSHNGKKRPFYPKFVHS